MWVSQGVYCSCSHWHPCCMPQTMPLCWSVQQSRVSKAAIAPVRHSYSRLSNTQIIGSTHGHQTVAVATMLYQPPSAPTAELTAAQVCCSIQCKHYLMMESLCQGRSECNMLCLGCRLCRGAEDCLACRHHRSNRPAAVQPTCLWWSAAQ